MPHTRDTSMTITPIGDTRLRVAETVEFKKEY
jgi:hypothetical protein